MTTDPSEETVVVANYPARHYAEMAMSYLEDQGIDAFVVADDVHVPLQLTEGARLTVMASRAEAAYDALAEVNLLPEHIAMDAESDAESDNQNLVQNPTSDP